MRLNDYRAGKRPAHDPNPPVFPCEYCGTPVQWFMQWVNPDDSSKGVWSRYEPDALTPHRCLRNPRKPRQSAPPASLDDLA